MTSSEIALVPYFSIHITRERYNETIKPEKDQRRSKLMKHHNELTCNIRKLHTECSCGQIVTIGSLRAHILTKKHLFQLTNRLNLNEQELL